MPPIFLLEEPSPEQLQPLFERMLKAGWISESGWSNEGSAVKWTPKGRRRMECLAEVVRQLTPRLFDPRADKPGVLRFALARLKFVWRSRELRRTKLTTPEETALLAYAAKWALEESEPEARERSGPSPDARF